MPKTALLLRAATLLVFFFAISAVTQPSTASFSEAQAVVARVEFHSQAELASLAEVLDIWEVEHAQGWLLAQLQPGEGERLRAAGYTFEIDVERTAVLQAAPQLSLQRAPEQASGIPGFACYRTVEETYRDLAWLAASRPQLARWVDIGDSWEKTTDGGEVGYDLYSLILTNRAVPGPKPVFLLMGAAHAREYATAETAARFAEHLLARYNQDADITWLLNEFEVHILAMANPDGRKKAEGGLYWRKNTASKNGCNNSDYWGTDLNRNSSFHWGGPGANSWACSDVYRGPAPVSEPEIQAFQAYAASLFPDQRGPLITDPAPPTTQGLFITLHSYGEMVLWPWGDSSQPAPNAAALQTLGRKLAYFNGYWPSQSINLYPTSGTNDDWTYGELGVAAYTYELGTYFFQDCASFETQIYPDNLNSLLYAFKSARRPYLTPSGPDSLDLALASNSGLAGQPLALTGRAEDGRSGSSSEPVQPIAAARYSLDRPSWIPGAITGPLQPADGNWNQAVELLQGAIPTTGLAPGRHTLFVESQDASGSWGPPSAVFFYVLEPSSTAAVQGYVRDARTNLPVEARVQAGVFQTVTRGGAYTLRLPSGNAVLSAIPFSPELVPVSPVDISAPAGETLSLDLIAYPGCSVFNPDCIPPLEPQARFTTQGVRSLGTPFQFTDLTTGSHPLQHTWDFGDGHGTASMNNPSYTYPEPGVYTITLTVTNTAGTSSFSGTVSVMPADWTAIQTVSVTAAGLHGEGQKVSLEVSVGPANVTLPFQYQIDFGSGEPPLSGESSQTTLVFEHSYPQVGVYPVRVSAWNAPTSFPIVGALELSIYRPIFLPVVLQR